MDLAGPPSSLRVAYERLGAHPALAALSRILNRLDLPPQDMAPPAWNAVNHAVGDAIFDRPHVTEFARSFTTWPCARAARRCDAQFDVSFAHCLWIDPCPCLECIAKVIAGDVSYPWTPRLMRRVALLHDDFVRFEEYGSC